MKKRSIKPKTLTLAAGIALLPFLLVAQQEEVRVVKPYSPTLSGAEKIEFLPDLGAEIEFEKPEFTYQLFPKRYESQFRAEPIRAARMVKMPLKKLYKTELTLGMGNYLTPLAELHINQLRSRNGTFGVDLKHHSMNGKLKLDNELKAPAGFNENKGEIYGSRFLKNAVFDFRAGASYNAYVHYGIDPSLDTVLSREDALHPYFTAAGGLGLHSMHADSFHFNYNTSLEYYFFTHQFEQVEHGARGSFDFNKRLRVVDLEGAAGLAYYGHDPLQDTILARHTVFWLNPGVAKSSQEWRFKAGVNAYGEIRDGEFTLHFYPRASFQFNIVREVIVPYFGVDGKLESNNFRNIVEENPYVQPGLSVRPTSHRLIGYMGLKGRFSDALAYNLKGSYAIVDDQYFFVNDTSSEWMNQFTVVYDDLTLINLSGEFTIRPSDAWKLFLKGNYYSYTLVREDHPWNRPSFDLSLLVRYNMRDKILLDAGITAIGARYYWDTTPSSDDTLPLVIDANLGIEYRYSTLLSFWARLDNLAAQHYYLYHNYPSFRFRAMLGFSYAL